MHAQREFVAAVVEHVAFSADLLSMVTVDRRQVCWVIMLLVDDIDMNSAHDNIHVPSLQKHHWTNYISNSGYETRDVGDAVDVVSFQARSAVEEQFQLHTRVERPHTAPVTRVVCV